MNKYLSKPDEIIDLHGLKLFETKHILANISKSSASHIRIITGKGNHSTNAAVLRKFVIDYLNFNNIKYNQSKIKDGGEGAFEIYLK